jgi:catechol 2,3-dioxygenase-like lactoylglutathione lyase family enzyme
VSIGSNPLVRNMNVNAVFVAAALAMTGCASIAHGAEPNPLKLTPHHATISVADLDKESQWYASVLGFQKSNPFENPGLKGCWMVIPGYRVDLIQQKGSSRKDTQLGLLRQGWLHVVFQTPMIEEALQRLRAAGTDVQAFKYGDHLQRLILHDPEGNEVELHT